MELKIKEKTKLTKPMEVAKIFNGFLGLMDDIEKEKEHLWCIGLDGRNVIKFVDLVTIGIIDETIMHPREIFRRAIVKGCSSIILGHNHPSGDVTPSDEDIIITNRIAKAGKLLGIALVDHVIVNGRPLMAQFTTLKGMGLIKTR